MEPFFALDRLHNRLRCKGQTNFEIGKKKSPIEIFWKRLTVN